MRNKGVVLAAIAAVGALLLSGCSTPGSNNQTGKVTLEWWHIQTQEPTRGTWQKLATDFEASHPNVTVHITVQNDPEFKTAIDARLQAGKPPDIFQTWGGGVLANQVKAGLVQDITASTSSWIGTLGKAPVTADQIGGKQYAVPYDAGLVGFWYNKALFAKAGISAPPTTWPDLLNDVKMLKASGVTPIALGAGDKWPAMFYWAELSLAQGGQKALTQAGVDGSFDSPPFVQAGQNIVELVKLGAFESGFLGTNYADATGSASLVANGKAAMELMGSWAPGTEASVAANGKGLGSDLSWFSFPSIPGGLGTPKEAFGGVNGFAVGKNAPPEAVEFLKFLSTVDSAKKVGAGGLLLPVTKGAEDSVQNPQQRLILDSLGTMNSVQSFLDQAYAPAVATAINDNVQTIFAGTQSPDAAAKAIAAVAKR